MQNDSGPDGRLAAVSKMIETLDLDSLHAELDRLNAQVRHVRRLIVAREAYQVEVMRLAMPSGFDNSCRVSSPSRRLLSIREMALEVLAGATKPMSLSEIREALVTTFGRPVDRTSLSPVLSKLTQSGTIVKEEVGWSMPAK